MFCRACGADSLSPLTGTPPAREEKALLYQGQPTEGLFFRCPACKSDSNRLAYADVASVYADPLYEFHIIRDVGREVAVDGLAEIFDGFDRHQGRCGGMTFLDIGCLDGLALEGMRARGWDAHGFDVTRRSVGNSFPLTVAPFFSAHLFGSTRFHAILCRDVIEHVEEWRELLQQIHFALHPNGLLQLVTPKPADPSHQLVYQPEHLVILHPKVLHAELDRLGYMVLESRVWDGGQWWMMQKTEGF